MRGSHSIELARLKKEEKYFGCLAAFWIGTFLMIFRATWGIAGHKNTRRLMVGCYKHLFIRLPFLRFGVILMYCHILRVRAIPTLESTRLYD